MPPQNHLHPHRNLPDKSLTDIRFFHNHALNNRPPGIRRPYSCRSDTHSAHTCYSDTRLLCIPPPDIRLLHIRSPDTRLLDTRPPDTRLLGTRLPDTRLGRIHLPDIRPPCTQLRAPRQKQPPGGPCRTGERLPFSCQTQVHSPQAVFRRGTPAPLP